MRPDPFSKALNHAYRLLSIRERSEKEIERRLREKGYGIERIKEVIEYLKTKNLLDDARFAQDWIKTCSTSRPKGVLAIKDELAKKGVREDIIEHALKDSKSGYNEYEVAKALTDKKLKSLKQLNEIKRKKSIYSYLARRGFSFDVINDIIDNI